MGEGSQLAPPGEAPVRRNSQHRGSIFCDSLQLTASKEDKSGRRSSLHRGSIFSESLLGDSKPPAKKSAAVGQYLPGVFMIGIVLATYSFLNGHAVFSIIHPKIIQSQYDYIIVGAGTSGSVLGDRLSEDSKSSILIVEAGGHPNQMKDIIDVPLLAEDLWGTSFDWSYETTPQKHSCKLHNGQAAKWPSGRGLGGTSLLNYMLYLRGSRHDYDEWALNGATGWAYKDVLPYFIKSEDNQNGGYINTVFHGSGGQLGVTDAEASPLSKFMPKAFQEIGVKKKDIHGKGQYGYMQVQATTRRGVRCSSYAAFLKRGLYRDNLHSIQNTQVQKLIFEGKKAVGILLERNGKPTIIKAKKEIILAAGTVGSAKLLLLSGVGPRKHLQAHNIPVVADLPVGENLQDHVSADGIEFFSPDPMSMTVARSDSVGMSWLYSLTGKGMKASPRFREGIAYVRTRYQPAHTKYPLIALHVANSINSITASHINMDPKIWKDLHGSPPSRDGFTIFPTLLHPRSKGTLRLKSSDLNDPPLINPNYLSEDADVKTLVEAYQYARRLIKTTVLKEMDIYFEDKPLAACEDHAQPGEELSDAYVECLIRHITIPGHAPVGTCKMGAVQDVTAVVDPQLKVKGLKNLRVVDASIFPNTLSGDTYASQVMLAEKASDMIKAVNSVKAIQDYFKHLIAVHAAKIQEEEEHHASTHPTS